VETKARTEKPPAEAREERAGCEERPLKAWATALRNLRGRAQGIFPEEFWRHRRAAKREALLALRSLLDAAIERLEQEPPGRGRKAPAKSTVQQ